MNTRLQVLGMKYVVEEKHSHMGRQGDKCFAGFVISVTDLARCDTKSSQSHFSAPRVPLHDPIMMAKRDPTPTCAAGKTVQHVKLATTCTIKSYLHHI